MFVFDHMRMSPAVMSVRNGMLMRMTVLLCQRVNNHYDSSQDHYGKSEKIC